MRLYCYGRGEAKGGVIHALRTSASVLALCGKPARALDGLSNTPRFCAVCTRKVQAVRRKYGRVTLPGFPGDAA